MKPLPFSLACLVLTSCLAAIPAGASMRPPQASAMRTGPAALPPLPYVKFCMQARHLCRDEAEVRLIALGEGRFEALLEVNRAVNRQIRPIRKSRSIAIEDWAINPASGDCNDYALSKRQQLLDRGFPRSALLLASATVPGGEGHLVLIARTDRGDFVLDNLQDNVVAWNHLPYRWLQRESAAQPLRWEKLAPGRPAANGPAISRAGKTRAGTDA